MSSLQHCYTTTTRLRACAAGAAAPVQVCLPPRRSPLPKQSLHTATLLSHSRLSNHKGSPVARPLSTVAVKAVVSQAEEMDSPAYDAKANNQYWERRPVPFVARLIVIGAELTRWYARSMLLKLRLIPQRYDKAGSPAQGTPTPASLMKDMLCRLGPAFIKIGQALSSRPDLLPPDYLVEFEQLQDRIPPFPSDQAFRVMESELGVSVKSTFSSFGAEPVAAASLGQVYRAKLRGSPGQPDTDVAVKVQRPGVAQSISLDVYILRWAAIAIRQFRKLNTDLPKLVDEWASSLFRELDYRTELENAERFKALYGHMKEIYVPAMYKEYTTSQVLTMEWIDGTRLRSASSKERMEAVMRRTQGPSSSSSSSSSGLRGSEEDLALVEAGVRCSLEQMLEDGFYHADPHPGNLLKMRDGRLAYLDFGMCGSIDKKTRQALVTSVLNLVNREYHRLADDFVSLGLLPEGIDKSKVVPALTEVFQTALAAGVTKMSFTQLSSDLGRTMYQFNFRIPPYYTLLVRSLTVLEGIALASNPDYQVLGSAYPWIARRLLTDRTPEMRDTLRALLYDQYGRFRFVRLESLLQVCSHLVAGDVLVY
ncbi:ABC1 family-domain-containing protein [Dunaliella salina]|uniref:ABC1 family-domain-containing protein n=1 Tax=Dunaliella salina TaxID=3046 RepID=A0ABQ7GZF4_DUNSA|nr:ABC1 family-domain-containing protein [Dunaliella salina]|eukprot:KAF5839993.1 ABC1 family-domain-containing protein [Dunaliella salina]